MSEFMQALDFRHACKKFDSNKKIPEAQFEQILEFGRKSPSSFGMEHWKFIVIQTPALREQLREACWGQPQITESSHVVVIVAKTQDVEPKQDYMMRLFKRRGLPDEAFQGYVDRYAAHFDKEIHPVMSTFAWSSKQCYIALANMLTGAASLGIDSCPIEGFGKAEVEKLLALDPKHYQVAVVAAFGYRAGEQSKQLRQSLAEIVEYR